MINKIILLSVTFSLFVCPLFFDISIALEKASFIDFNVGKRS